MEASSMWSAIKGLKWAHIEIVTGISDGIPVQYGRCRNIEYENIYRVEGVMSTWFSLYLLFHRTIIKVLSLSTGHIKS